MARQSRDRRNADDPDAGAERKELSDLDTLDDDRQDAPEAASRDADPAVKTDGADDADADSADADDAEGDEVADDEADASDADEDRDEATETLWAELRVDPIEIALPTGAGFTLRAYRPLSALTPSEIEKGEDEEDDDPFAAAHARRALDEDEVVLLDEWDEEEDEEEAADGRRRRSSRARETDDEAPDSDETETEADETDDAQDGDADEKEEADEEEEEEVPIFLGHQGRLFLFRTKESLVDFVRSDAPHDLAQLDTWSEVVARIQPENVVATEDDSYELDLVVENLRGGHDTWDAPLIISAGEVARDIAYAYRIERILIALSPGTPLDDLDEALRGTVDGGLGSFFARRRVKKIGAQQATLGWRTIIGKISGVVVWRD